MPIPSKPTFIIEDDCDEFKTFYVRIHFLKGQYPFQLNLESVRNAPVYHVANYTFRFYKRTGIRSAANLLNYWQKIYTCNSHPHMLKCVCASMENGGTFEGRIQQPFLLTSGETYNFYLTNEEETQEAEESPQSPEASSRQLQESPQSPEASSRQVQESPQSPEAPTDNESDDE